MMYPALHAALWGKEFRQRTLPRLLLAVSACLFTAPFCSSPRCPPSPASQVPPPLNSCVGSQRLGLPHLKRRAGGDRRGRRHPPPNGRAGMSGRRRRDQLKESNSSAQPLCQYVDVPVTTDAGRDVPPATAPLQTNTVVVGPPPPASPPTPSPSPRSSDAAHAPFPLSSDRERRRGYHL